MNQLNLLISAISIFFILLGSVRSQDFNEDQIAQIQGQIDSDLKTNYPNFETATNAEKEAQFSIILNSIANNVLSSQWQHPTGSGWPVLDWSKVDKLDMFFNDQFEIVNTLGAVAQTNEDAARFSYAASLLSHTAAIGEDWFQSWLIDLAKSDDSNLKRLVFISAEDVGEDFTRTHPDEQPSTDWNEWKQAYDQSNKLGKAILLKCMTRLALITGEWDKLREIHLSVFNGTDDELKAIALVKSDNGLSDEVIAKWREIAENSANAKLKSLAQEVLEIQKSDDEQPE